MPYSPIKVGNEFLRLARGSNPPRLISPLKLLKLVYIAHGWSWHFFDRALINESVEAWQYGPVVGSLYRAIRSYRDQPITENILGDLDNQVFSEDDRQLIETVFGAYDNLSGIQLSNMTHLPDTPWSEAWNLAGRNATISEESIKRHYDVLGERNRARQGVEEDAG